MSRAKLTARTCVSLPAGRHADGAGLYLNVTAAGGRSWVYRYTWGGKRREMGLGAFPAVSLLDARKGRDEWARLLREGQDPLSVRGAAKARASVAGRTFADMTAAAFEAIKPSLRDGGNAGRWLSPLKTHVLPVLGRRDVESITQLDIEATLKPIWRSKPDAARKALQRLAIVMRHAAARSFAVDLNAPELARALLGEQGHKPQHIPAMPWRDVPAFYATLTEATPVQLALRLLILTATRSRPVRYAHVDQFDLATHVWTIPADGDEGRMKSREGKGEAFRVPLSQEALSVVKQAIEQSRDGFLFPGQKRRKVISDMSMSAHLRRVELDARPHGFRSSFRDWAAESGVPEHLAEMCLAHAVGNKVSRAYRRTDEIEARESILEAWSLHIVPPKDNAAVPQNVVSLK